jgi:glycosyltransferase involved in cell wall biosynthesis
MIEKNYKVENYLEEKEVILQKSEFDENLMNESKTDSSVIYYIKWEFILKIFKYKNFILMTLILLLSLFYYIPMTELYSDYEKIKNFTKDNLEGKLYNSISLFKKSENPLISIVISTFNGEIYLKPAVRSIQNQDFFNLEIIIVDDGSVDNSVKVVEELMKEDPRIILIKNGINRGTLYTKTRGVLNAKGKYVMTLDHDNLYTYNNVFSTLYNESEKYNLDLLGFASVETTLDIRNSKKVIFYNYKNSQIIKQPIIKTLFIAMNYRFHSSTSLCLYFIKKELYFKVIKQLGEEIINRNIDAHDDTIITFLLARKALNLKHLKKIFYFILIWPKEYYSSLTLQRNVKKREREKKNCYSYLTFAEVLILHTENDKRDKKIAEFNFLRYFIRNEKCQNQTDIIDDTIRISNLYLKDKYINLKAKEEISLFLNQQNKYINS